MSKRIEQCSPADVLSFSGTHPRTLYTLFQTAQMTFGIECVDAASSVRLIAFSACCS